MPGANTRFVGWTGECSGNGACSVTVDGTKSVGAIFAAYQLTVAVTGQGSVELSNPMATCPTQCTQVYTGAGDTVTLTPKPASGQAFGGWGGDCVGYGPCELLMDQSHSASATFGTARTLTVNLAGGGQGTVTSAEGAINCGTACANDYVDGTMVTLTATPETGHVFSGFSPPGACSSSAAGSCTVTMDAAKTVTATFNVVGIDLTIGSVVCTPNSFKESAPLSCAVTVRNLGDTASPATTIDFFESRDRVRGPSDYRIGTCSVPAIAAAGSQNVTCNVSWQRLNGTQAIYGPAFVLAFVDPNNLIAEASDDNNSATSAVNVTTGGAELVVSAFTCTPSAANPGRDIACSATVWNAGDSTTLVGNVAATSILYIAPQPDSTTGPMIGSCTPISNTTPIAAQSSITLNCTGTIPVNQPPGTIINIAVYVDNNNRIVERNDNNTASLPFVVTVPGAVDLAAQSLTCPTNAAPGDTVTCSVKLTNWGELTAQPFTIDVRLSDDATIDTTDALIGTCRIGAPLRSGQTTVVACSGMVPNATPISVKQLGIILDSANATGDTKPTNNTLSKSLTIGPDITVTSLSCPAAAARNGSISCTVTLANVGSQPTGAFSSVLHFSTDNVADAGDATIGLACNALAMQPGTTQSINCGGTIPSGAAIARAYVWLQADSTSAVTEANEMNNSRVVGIGVGPNIAMTGFSCTSPITRGTAFTCTGTLVNNGAETTSVGFANQLYLSTDGTISNADTLLTNCGSVGALAAGATASFTCNGNVSTGVTVNYYYIGVLLDSGGAVTEFDETDNPWQYTYVQ